MSDWFYLGLNILIVIVWLVAILSISSLASTFWFFYIQEKFIKKQEYILLEIRIPEEIKKPVESIEQLFHASWDMYEDPPRGIEKWLKKWRVEKHTLSYSCEIISIEGSIHFFLRIPKTKKSLFESVLYSEFPGLEILEKEDYINLVPDLIPNQNWDIEINDFILKKEHFHPITFYSEINKSYVFEEQEELLKQPILEKKKEEGEGEKIIDPMAFFLEEMSKIGKREHLWFQIIITPIDDEIPWKKRGENIVRAGGKEQKSIILFSDIFQALKNFWEKGIFYETAPKKQQNKADLLEKEREIIKRIEKKIRKYGFESVIRGAYIAHKDVFLKSKADIFKNYLFSFASPYSNNFSSWKGFKNRKTNYLEKIPYLFINKLKKQEIRKQIKFQDYLKRDILSNTDVIRRYFSKGFGSKQRGSSVLNTEELATLYHFPKITVFSKPSLPRILFKKVEPLKTLLYD